jgi:hypothetical protein
MDTMRSSSRIILDLVLSVLLRTAATLLSPSIVGLGRRVQSTRNFTIPTV